jgi:MoaA/NifB/PqqE/SkfB family radical SAM enzyme
VNPFQHLYDECNTGDPAEKYRDLPEFKATFMTEECWNRIVGQCVQHDTAIRLIGWGEPLMHPKVICFVKDAAYAGLLIHINTNASHINGGTAAPLVEAGLASIKFSFQGVDKKSYEEMRQTDFFEGMIKAIELMKRARGDRPFPYIAASTSVTYETEEQIEAFRERLAPLVDHLGIGRTIFDFMDLSAVRLKPDQIALLTKLKELCTDEGKHPDPCPEVYQKLSIHADGTMVVCCNDYNQTTNLGNVLNTPMIKAWRHPVMEEYRKRLANKEYSGPLCGSCYDYQSLTGG